MQEKITAFIAERYGVLTNLSIEEALRQSTPEQAGEDLKQLWDLACPLWRYDEAKIPIEDAGTIHEDFYYGTADANVSILNDPIIQQKLPSRGKKPNIVPTGDPTRITLFRVRVGVPLFALQGIDEMKQHYDDPSRAFKHLHKDWASFPDLIPVKQEDDEKLRYFTLGISLGIIRKSLGRYIAEDLKTTLGENRPSAFKKLKQSRELFDFVKERVDREFKEKTAIGTDDVVVSMLRNTVQEMRKQLSGKLEAMTVQQMQVEIEVLERYIDRITTNS